MAAHTLSTEQVHKLLHAVGAVAEIPGGQFTTEQLRQVIVSNGGLQSWPNATDDPQVNFAVDCIVQDDDAQPVYDEKLYVAEVEAFRANGPFA